MPKAALSVTTGDMERDRIYAVGNEVAVLDRIKADVAAGKDPYGEDEDDDPNDLTALPVDVAAPPPAAAPAAAPAPAPVETAHAPAPAPVEAPAAAPIAAPAPGPAAVAVPVEVAAPAPAVGATAVDLTDLMGLTLPTVPTVDEAGFKTARSALRTQISEIDAKWEKGEIDPAVRSASVGALQDQIDDLTGTFSSQVGTRDALAHVAQATHAQVLGRIQAAGARDGLDYSQPFAQEQFNLASQMVQASPKNAGISWVKVAQLADEQVRAMNGIAVKGAAAAPAAPPVEAPVAAPAAAAAPAPGVKQPPAPPPTLRTLPVAAGAGAVTDTIASKLAAGDANQRNMLWDKMSPAQRAAARGDDDE